MMNEGLGMMKAELIKLAHFDFMNYTMMDWTEQSWKLDRRRRTACLLSFSGWKI